MWIKFYKGDVVFGGYLLGIFYEEVNGIGISIWSWYIFFESVFGEMNGFIINLKVFNWESFVEI